MNPLVYVVIGVVIVVGLAYWFTRRLISVNESIGELKTTVDKYESTIAAQSKTIQMQTDILMRHDMFLRQFGTVGTVGKTVPQGSPERAQRTEDVTSSKSVDFDSQLDEILSKEFSAIEESRKVRPPQVSVASSVSVSSTTASSSGNEVVYEFVGVPFAKQTEREALGLEVNSSQELATGERLVKSSSRKDAIYNSVSDFTSMLGSGATSLIQNFVSQHTPALAEGVNVIVMEMDIPLSCLASTNGVTIEEL